MAQVRTGSRHALAARLRNMEESATMAVMVAAQKLRARGIKVVDLGAGEPDFNTPENVKAAAKRAIDANFTRYTPAAGTPELRNAILQRYRIDFGVERGQERRSHGDDHTHGVRRQHGARGEDQRLSRQVQPELGEQLAQRHGEQHPEPEPERRPEQPEDAASLRPEACPGHVEGRRRARTKGCDGSRPRVIDRRGRRRRAARPP